MFTGKDCSVNLAKMDLKSEHLYNTLKSEHLYNTYHKTELNEQQ